MSRITQFAVAASLLTGGATPTLAQDSGKRQGEHFCGITQIIVDNTTKNIESCFVREGDRVVHLGKDGDSVHMGMYLYKRTGSNIVKEFVGNDVNKMKKDIQGVQDCVREKITSGRLNGLSQDQIFTSQLTCLQK